MRQAKKNIYLSGQLLLALAVIVGISSTAYAKPNKTFKSTYKVERCDCLGFSEDIPTFLSDLSGAQDLDIYGEGKTLKDAQRNAQNMCVEAYRNFASVSEKEHPDSVTQSGCHTLRSTPDGQWVSL